MANALRLKELEEFLDRLCDNLGEAIEDNAIPSGWLCSSEGNQNYMLHSRVWGILAKTGFDLGYIVEVDAGFKANGLRQFKPDLQLWKSDELRFLIEYESTNSSNDGVFLTDLRRYHYCSTENSVLPFYWVVIYTLPDHKINPSTWIFWGLKRSDPQVNEIARNPHGYYKRFLDRTIRSEQLENITCGESNRLFLVNLSEEGLEVDLPARFSQKYLFKPSGV